ncbi:MAG: hypothetical protein FXF47_06495 [Candidatus Mcinerneyibacterium aminivorans]|jgi:hypothetical protein|uniref:Uncharacterized protein n=1 Tax=Candidatus Mcinerneyibacterium aminivorans TaxID=2703815 RepID=A0A5D0MB26_9BACT|nr:MAG: hypothetical protein FXF47_06495 [Candidatus Mcinerneyibacterium aminivorans]
MKELSEEKLRMVNGGKTDWRDIAAAIGVTYAFLQAAPISMVIALAGAAGCADLSEVETTPSGNNPMDSSCATEAPPVA